MDTSLTASRYPLSSADNRPGFSGAHPKRQLGAQFGATINPQKIPLPLWAKPLDALFEKGLNTRTKEMLLEDLLGFALLRTGIDLYRQRIMRKGRRDEHGHEELNVSAARERLLREVASIMTDNVSGGIFAFLVACGANRFAKLPNLSKHFVSDQTLTLFKQVLDRIPDDAWKTQEGFENAFRQEISKTFGLSDKALAGVWRQPEVTQASILKNNALCDQKLAEVLKATNPNAETFQLKPVNKAAGALGQESFHFQELVQDTKRLMRTVKELPASQVTEDGVKKTVRSVLAQSARVNRLQYLGIAFAIALTFGVPFAIQAMTRKVDGFTNYPGDRGIKKMTTTQEQDKQGKNWFERNFPYLSDCVKRKSPVALLPIIPLMFAFGLFDTRHLSRFAFKEAFNAPWKKEFIPRLKEMYRFGKGAPFTTQQQMASCFAFLIFSRMVSARSDIEFRERSVDSMLGWATWILGTPILKRGLSKLLQNRVAGVKLFNKAGELRTRTEIEHLPMLGEQRSRTLAAHLFGRFTSMLFTVLTLGILEPVAAIKWTAHRADRHRQAQEKNALQTSDMLKPQYRLA